MLALGLIVMVCLVLLGRAIFRALSICVRGTWGEQDAHESFTPGGHGNDARWPLPVRLGVVLGWRIARRGRQRDPCANDGGVAHLGGVSGFVGADGPAELAESDSD